MRSYAENQVCYQDQIYVFRCRSCHFMLVAEVEKTGNFFDCYRHRVVYYYDNFSVFRIGISFSSGTVFVTTLHGAEIAALVVFCDIGDYDCVCLVCI